ncbi:MAG: D-cysteine desulfhydrase family protein [Anaerolineae bacterium]|nr:D-cysteine desulfhydrase family protein [Anaerolineae bacterium]
MHTQELTRRLQRLNPLPLGTLPTPLHRMPRLSAALRGPEIWIKRDDLTGLGMGGNKVRKLRFLLSDAIRAGAGVIMTTGAQQSNHARQTAAAARCLGLPAILVLGGERPEIAPQGNYLLDRLLGAEVRWASGRSLMQALEEEAQLVRDTGRRPYVVPYGGSSPLGICGFVEALVELQQQAASAGIAFDAVVVASSSGGTQTGLVVGARALALETRIVGISIADPALPFCARMGDLASQTSALLGLDTAVEENAFDVFDAYLGDGYGVVGDLERAAIALAARTEGILVDPVYTGRALGGLVDLIRQGVWGAGERVLFWHTGGTPALFAYAEEWHA